MHRKSAIPASAGLRPDNSEFLQTVLDTAGLAVIVLDRDGSIRLFNRTCEKLSGYSAAEVLGRDFFEFLPPPEQRDDVRGVFDRLMAGDYPNEYENDWLTKSGQSRRLHWHNTVLTGPDDRIEYVVATGIDITDHRRTEMELRYSARQMRLLIDHSPALIGHLDTGLCFVFANESYREWFNLPLDDILGRHVREIIGDEAFFVLGPKYKQALAGEIVHFDGEVPYQHAGKRYIHGTYVPHTGKDGQVDGLLVMNIDLSEQHRLASALSSTNRRNQAMLDTAVDGIITINERGIVESFNRSAERIFGYRPAEVIGQNVKMLMPSEIAGKHDDYLKNYLQTGERHIIGIGREVTGLRKDGTLFPMELSVGEFFENGRHFFAGFTRDISDRKRVEQESKERLDQLSHVARQNSLGLLTSGLAHEINQPLTAVITTAQACLRLLQDERATPEILERSLGQIINQGQRASNIISEMRQFLRKSDTQNRSPVDINSLVPGVLDLVSHEISHHEIEIEMNLDENIPFITASQVQIEQVLLNLVRNSIEALSSQEKPRCLEIQAGHAETDNESIAITVADNGPGLPKEIRERLFEPFTTTKENGLGQGLAISRSIVRAHGGDIKMINRQNMDGACFCITLPIKPDTS